MYRAFKIRVDKNFEDLIALNDSNAIDKTNSELLVEKLRTMLNEEKILNADSIRKEWFPDVDAQVFISHSSNDSKITKKFAEWLRRSFCIKTFVDSDLWGHSDKLLKEIDKKFCYKSASKTYDYDKRNGSTAHVHQILSYALTRMIDESECFIFLESENSVTLKNSINKISSPWIFHELVTVDTIEIKEKRKKLLIESKLRNFSDTKNLEVLHDYLSKRLVDLDLNKIKMWKSSFTNKNENALDVLYSLVPIK